MTTKTTKKQAESAPESTPEPTATNGVVPTADLGELSAEEKALIAAVRSTEQDSITQAISAMNTAWTQHHAEEAEEAKSVDDLAHTLEQLTPERRTLFGAMVDAAHRVQHENEWAEWNQRAEVERQHKLKEARRMAKSNELDDVERVSLLLIGNLAMNYDIKRDSLYENGLESLFRVINNTLREGLAHADFHDLEVIVEAERAGISTAPKMWGYGDDEDDDEESDDGELPKSA